MKSLTGPTCLQDATLHGADGGPLHPMALLFDDLRSEDVVARLKAVHRLSTIALALGPERTRDELIVFLLESLDDEE